MSFLSFCKSNKTIDRRTFITSSGIACISLMLFPSFAAASPIWGTPLKKTVREVTYTYMSGLEMAATPRAYTKITSSKMVAAGTMQARAFVVKDPSMNIVTSSKWIKNARGTSVQASVSSSALKLGCRSKGKVQIKNVRGQLSCNPIRTRSLAPELSVNEHGQTLGTYEDVERGAVPDLVGIVADSGIDGYAYWEQFDAEDASDAIPVYAEDGTTQVGIFTFGDK